MPSGSLTLFEVRAKEGKSWKIASFESHNTTTYFVINSGGQVAIVATTFDDGPGGRHAVVLVDSAEKEEAMAVLDKKFLSSLNNASDEYRKWQEKNAVFSYGGVQETRTIDSKEGGLGSSSLGIDGNTIVGRVNQISCHCGEIFCPPHNSLAIACINKVCDLINCIIKVINGESTNCDQEGSEASQFCSAFANN